MDIPFLFDANRLFDKELPVFKTQAFINCGRSLSAYRRYKSIPEDVRDVLNSSSEDFRTAWKNEFAAEALLAELAADGLGKHFPFHEVSPEAQPCGKYGPSYKILEGNPHSLALFPITDEISHTTCPSIGRIWIFNTTQDALPLTVSLDGYDVFAQNLKEHHHVFLDYSHIGIDPQGRSWELAGALAFSFLGDPYVSFDLATAWLVTGSLEAHQLRKVGLHNKLSLEADGRLWLLPRTNKEDVGQNNNHLSIEYAYTFDEAKVIIRGSPRVNKTDEKPEKDQAICFNIKEANKTTETEIAMEKLTENNNISADTKNSASENNDAKLVIRMTSCRPIRINESKWPIIMKAHYKIAKGDEYAEYPDINGYTVYVRAKIQGNKVFYILHGEKTYESLLRGIDSEAVAWAGEYIKNASLDEGNHRSPELLQGIRNIAKKLGLGEDNLIDVLMFSQEPLDLD